MARISFEAALESENNRNSNPNSVEFFTLKNDGDEAIVRIMHDSTADFDIMSCHNVKVGDKYRKVNCIRDPREPIDNCPLCANNAPIQQRFFIHMIQYDKDAQGNVTPKGVVWERTAGEYGTKLKTLIESYGPLSDCIFKIKRNGKAGDMGTTYEIMYAPPTIYRPDLYPKVPEIFANYSACGTVVIDRPYEDIVQFVATGAFPEKPQANNTTAQSAASVAQQAPPVQYRTNLDAVIDDTPNVPPASNSGTAAPNNVPWNTAPTNAPGGMSRPTRYY